MIKNKKELRLKRLKHLIVVLKKVPVSRFNMLFWGRAGILSKIFKIEMPKNFIKTDCRTAACALGWAAMDKEFVKEGLGIFLSHYDESGQIYYKDFINIKAGSEFFGITYEESKGLFDPLAYTDRETKKIEIYYVVKKIKNLIAFYS